MQILWVLAGFAVLAAALTWLWRRLETQRLIRQRMAVVACFLGMGSALTAVTAPLVVLLYNRFFLAESWGDLCRWRAGLYAAFAECWAAFAASVLLVGYNPQAVGFAISGVSPAAYVLPFVVVAVLLAATVWALLRRPKVGFLGAWFFLTLAPTSSFVPHAEAAGDYRMYLPLAAVAVALVLAGFARVQWAGERAPWTVYAAVGVALLAVGALGFATFRRNADYESPLAIWQDTVSRRPGDALAHFQLGNVELQLGVAYAQKLDLPQAKAAVDRAVVEYRAVVTAPDDDRNASFLPAAWYNLGVALVSGSRPDVALRELGDAPRDAAGRVQRLNDFGVTL